MRCLLFIHSVLPTAPYVHSFCYLPTHPYIMRGHSITLRQWYDTLTFGFARLTRKKLRLPIRQPPWLLRMHDHDSVLNVPLRCYHAEQCLSLWTRFAAWYTAAHASCMAALSPDAFPPPYALLKPCIRRFLLSSLRTRCHIRLRDCW
ncbi:hypothetical protein BDW02DRAFT_313824 [Decorospora gaudefroyi]|uniref:Uncharacterized protein n=1 Tax=Decorospora gaudefroyi TaxID=184978 RepID=A0A6A5KC85_9PLEO|nr:hypothetical protein BDW02DRAFT_313824 [Decorospora gaudefroyi]